LRATREPRLAPREQGRAQKPATFSLRLRAGSLQGFDTPDLKEAKAMLDEMA